jgi:hypothetical protein
MTKTYTIDTDNCLFVTPSKTTFSGEELQSIACTFTTQEELATATQDWPASRLVEVWNSFAGAPPFGDLKEVKRFTDRKSAVARIWNAAAEPAPAAKPKKAKAAPTAAKGAPAKAKATKDTTAKDDTTGAKTPRDGSKTAQVVAMLQRKNGATLAEIMDKMGWQKHTVRGFMAGAMKKAGHIVESFKPEGGERTYRLCGAPHKR